MFEEGEQGDECYLLHTGAVKVVRRFPDGRRVTLARMGPGSVVGELALFNGERRSATVEAVEPTVAVALAGDHVMSLLRGDAEAALSVAIGLAERLRASNERLFEHALATVCRPRGRHVARPGRGQAGPGATAMAAATSSWSAARSTSPGSPAFRARAPRRVLHWLENEGIVTLKRGKTVVHDPDALSRYLS